MTARFVNEQSLAATARLLELAQKCGMSLPTFAIAWTLTRDFVGSTLVGATSAAQLDETLAAAQATLPPEALAEVDAISREIRYPLG
jgi:aryl-alcohol dehydrogenase-like predicted oxidoreductase